MNIFFTAAIRGSRKETPLYQEIVSLLQNHGTVLNQEIANPNISQYGETDMSEQEIFQREQERLRLADMVIAEGTTPSLGVGFLIAQAVMMKKPVLVLYHEKYADKLSAMIKGCKDITIKTYEHIDELPDIFQKYCV